MTTKSFYENLDDQLTSWMSKHGIKLLRISIGIVFVWFGVLKYFDHLSPAQDLAINTMQSITSHLFPDKFDLYLLATLEVLIGIGLIFRVYLRLTLFLLFTQMLGTFTPIFLFPEDVFNVFPYGLTLEGQYIMKNLIIISAGIVIGSTAKLRKENEMNHA